MLDNEGELELTAYSGSNFVEEQKDSISWGNSAIGKYYLQILRTTPNSSNVATITYYDGFLETNNHLGYDSVECTESEAKQALESLILGASITPLYVTGAQRGELDGEYVITLSPQEQVSVTVTVTMDDDKITKIEWISLKGETNIIKTIVLPIKN